MPIIPRLLPGRNLEDLLVEAILGDKSKKDWNVELFINGCNLSFEVDSGTYCNVI